MKSFRNNADPLKSKALIQMNCVGVAGYYCVELKNSESILMRFCHAVLHQFFSDMLSAESPSHRVGSIADMAAASDIIRMKDVHPDDLSADFVFCNTGIRLLTEKRIRMIFCERLLLWKGHAILHNLVPYFHHRICIRFRIFSDHNIHRSFVSRF